MKEEKELIREKEDWIDETVERISERMFKTLEEAVNTNFWNYWETGYISIPCMHFDSIKSKVYTERGMPNLENQYHNIDNLIWEKVNEKIKEELKMYGWKLVYNQKDSSEVFLTAIETDIGYRTFSEKIAIFFRKKSSLNENPETTK